MLIGASFATAVERLLFKRSLLRDSRLVGRVLRVARPTFYCLLLTTGTSSQLCSFYPRFTTAIRREKGLANLLWTYAIFDLDLLITILNLGLLAYFFFLHFKHRNCMVGLFFSFFKSFLSNLLWPPGPQVTHTCFCNPPVRVL